MSEVAEIVRQNCLNEVSNFFGKRAVRAIDSERPLWESRAFALLAASRLSANRAGVILQLRATQGRNPHFVKLCQNLM
jgi:hypothetical protein